MGRQFHRDFGGQWTIHHPNELGDAAVQPAQPAEQGAHGVVDHPFHGGEDNAHTEFAPFSLMAGRWPADGGL